MLSYLLRTLIKLQENQLEYVKLLFPSNTSRAYIDIAGAYIFHDKPQFTVIKILINDCDQTSVTQNASVQLYIEIKWRSLQSCVNKYFASEILDGVERYGYQLQRDKQPGDYKFMEVLTYWLFHWNVLIQIMRK